MSKRSALTTRTRSRSKQVQEQFNVPLMRAQATMILPFGEWVKQCGAEELEAVSREHGSLHDFYNRLLWEIADLPSWQHIKAYGKRVR